MTIRILIAAAVFSFSLVNSAGAVRVLDQAERGVELSVNQLTLPTDGSGTLSFKTCAECRISTHSVTATTKYLLNGREMALADFLLVIEEIRSTRTGAETATAAVYLDLATERVTRVAVNRGS